MFYNILVFILYLTIVMSWISKDRQGRECVVTPVPVADWSNCGLGLDQLTPHQLLITHAR
jgi:hypothetical protein